MNAHGFLSFTALVASILVGCAVSTSPTPDTGAGSGPGTGDTLDGFCGNYCQKLSTCDHTRDLQTCTNSCNNEFAAVFPKIRGDVVTMMENCTDSNDCATALGSGDIGQCATQAEASIAPTESAKAFCGAYVAAQGKCGTTEDMATCLNSAKLFNDDAINLAANCVTKSCTDIDSCVSAALGSLTGGTATTSGGGESCVQSQSCGGSHTLTVCTSTDSSGQCTGTRYKLDNGQTFTCSSCGNCGSAAQQASAACQAEGGGNGNSCSQTASNASCSSCCSSANPGGVQALDNALVQCECSSPGVCYSQCYSELCAGGSVQPGGSCDLCLQGSIQQGGACSTSVSQSCGSSSACSGYMACINNSGCSQKQ